MAERTPKRTVMLEQGVVCHDCGEPISRNCVLLEAMGKTWHVTCFTCSVCKTPQPDSYYEDKGHIYCREHFYSTYAHRCHKCSGYITGPAMTAGFKRLYHPECFFCSTCSQPLGENDTYSLLSSGKILCNDCSQIDGSGSMEDSDSDIYTSFQLIKISIKRRVKFRLQGDVPPISSHHRHKVMSGFSTPQLPRPGEKKQKNSLRIEKLPRSLQNSPLKPEDQILEINGVVIVNQDQAEINALMHAYDDCLYLTIERKKPKKSKAMGSPKHVSSNPAYSPKENTSNPASIRQDTSSTAPLRHVTSSPAVSLKHGTSNPAHSIKKQIMREFPHVTEEKKEEEYQVEPKDGGREELVEHTDGENWSHPQEVDSFRLTRTKSLPAKDFKAEFTRCFRLSDLQIGEVLGQGFYGTISKVTHRHTGQVMVMKEMVNCTDEAKKVFAKEVRMLKQLNHHNIVHFIGIIYKEGKLLTLIIEYIAGGTLRKTIKKLDNPFPWDFRIQIARDISAGMSYLHHKGIIHRDLTSKNCLLREDMTTVVADFGLARVFNPISVQDHPDGAMPPKTLTKRRMTVVGSPYVMAPEMLRGEVYNEKVDVFSYGIVLCETIARVKSDPDHLPREKNFGLDEPNFRRLCQDCPPPLYSLAVECCSLSPDKRPTFHSIEHGLNILLSVARSKTCSMFDLQEDFSALSLSLESVDSGVACSNGHVPHMRPYSSTAVIT